MKTLQAQLLIALFLLTFSSCAPRRMEKGSFIFEEPPRYSSNPKKLEKIVIDAGHGGKDSGAQSDKNRYEEKKLTLQTAQLVQKFLNEMGYDTYLTRDEDQYVSLDERARIANAINAHLFVSVHYNFSHSSDAEGIEVFYYKDVKNPESLRLLESKKLGESVLDRILKHTGAQSRGVKTANFAVIRETKMPAILIEGGFLSNPAERERLKDPQYCRFMALGIAKGIDRYFEAQRKK